MFYLDGVSWNSPVWYLVVLFWARLFYQLLSRKNIFIIITIGFMSLLCYYSVLSSLPLGLNILPNAVIFLGIGLLLSKTEFSNKLCWLAIPLLAISLIGGILNGRISMYGNDFGNYILALPVGISGVLGIFLIAKPLFKPNKVYDYLQKTGKISLNIMCTHYFILRFFSILSKYFFNGYDIWNSESFIKAIVITAVIIVVELESLKMLKKLNIPSSNIMRI